MQSLDHRPQPWSSFMLTFSSRIVMAAFAGGLMCSAAAAQAPATKAPPSTATSPAPAQAADIVDTAIKANSFSTLVKAVQAAGLVDTLKGKGPFTVFAPTDAAFAKLPAATLESLLKPENKATLTAILTYHVVPGRYSAQRLLNARAKRFGIPTAQGAPLHVDIRSGVKVSGATVIQPDVAARNGIIHAIDTVMLPPKVKKALAAKKH
jgi:uncharacterized surface protein with fasciclin (FAS1) repeats